MQNHQQSYPANVWVPQAHGLAATEGGAAMVNVVAEGLNGAYGRTGYGMPIHGQPMLQAQMANPWPWASTGPAGFQGPGYACPNGPGVLLDGCLHSGQGGTLASLAATGVAGRRHAYNQVAAGNVAFDHLSAYGGQSTNAYGQVQTYY